MHCDPLNLSLYSDGELSPEDYREMTLHLKRCRSCRRELAEIRRVNHVVSSWGSVRQPIPLQTESRIRGSVDRRSRLSPLLRLSRLAPPAIGSSLAALLLLLTVNFGSVYQMAVPSSPSHTQTWQQIKKQSAPLQLARVRAAVVSTQATNLPRLVVRRHLEASLN